MAILKSEDLSFSFEFSGLEYGWVQYQFAFLWKNQPIVKDSMLKKSSEYWKSRGKGAFLANDHEREGFLPFLKEILETDQADYWEPIEPDIIVAIYPDDYFPFLKSHRVIISEREDVKLAREARQALKKQGKKLPDDLYTFICFVDAYNFKNADAYYGQGFSMHMIVSRKELEEFVNELEMEYQEFNLRHKVDEYVFGG